MYVFTDHNIDHKKITMLEWILKDQVKNCQETDLSWLVAKKINISWQVDQIQRPNINECTHPPIFNRIQLILSLAKILETM